jgi:predicted dithiol-disulfide oxidoreductase (DUF899 family)
MAPRIVGREEWAKERAELLEKEKAHTRAGDELAKARRELPWVEIEDYELTAEDGRVRLSELFGDKSQLVVYHFMFGADWDKPCPSCSFWADHFDGTRAHLARRDTAFVVISRAPIDKLAAWKPRARWRFPWISSAGTSFNDDFHATSSDGREQPVMSVFTKNDAGVFHTYSASARGLEAMNNTYSILDLVPKGRDEDGLEWTMAWVERLAELSDEERNP